MIYFTICNVILLMIIAFIHIYWAMGGNKGINIVIPENKYGKQLFQPNMLITLAVSIALICYAYFHYSYIHSNHTIKKLSGYFLLIGALIFIARAIGDFNYMGFFKKIRNTKFAKYDTYLYTPLSIIIALLAIITYAGL